MRSAAHLAALTCRRAAAVRGGEAAAAVRRQRRRSSPPGKARTASAAELTGRWIGLNGFWPGKVSPAGRAAC